MMTPDRRITAADSFTVEARPAAAAAMPAAPRLAYADAYQHLAVRVSKLRAHLTDLADALHPVLTVEPEDAISPYAGENVAADRDMRSPVVRDLSALAAQVDDLTHIVTALRERVEL